MAGGGLGGWKPGRRALLRKAPLYLSWSRWFSALCFAETLSSRGRFVWPRWARRGGGSWLHWRGWGCCCFCSGCLHRGIVNLKKIFRAPARVPFCTAKKEPKTGWGFARTAYGICLQPLGRAPQTPLFTGALHLGTSFYHRRVQS